MRVKVVPMVLALVGVGVGYGVLSTVFAGGAGYGLATSVPAETAVWIEARDARTAIETFRTASCFAEFQRSNSMKKLEEGWKELISINESPMMADWKALGLDVSEETLMLGLGQSVAIGAMVPRPTGQPSVYFATKLDVIGLAKKVAVSGDWTALWDKLQTVVGGKDAAVEQYKEYELVTRATGGVEVTFALLRDLLVASPDKDTVKALVDVHLGQRETLAARKAFKDELDELPASPAAVTWVDLELLRDKDRFVAAIKAAAGRVGAESMVKEFDGTELSVLQADLADRGGVAWGMYIPDGELYSARLELARPEALFKDQAEHDLRAVLSDQTVMYAEARGVYPLFEGFFQSETLKAIRNTPAWKWVATKLEKPSSLADIAPGALPPAPELENDPSFELKLSAALLQLPLRELLGNDVAMALEIHEAAKLEDGFAPAFFLRSRPLIRVITDLGAGVMVAQQKRGMPTIEVITHGKRTIYGYVGDKPGVYFAQLGSELCASTKKEMVQRLIDACDGGSTAIPSTFQQTLTRLPDGYQFFAYYDLKKYMAGIQKVLPPMDEEQKKAMELMSGAESVAVAAYVSQDYTTWTMRAWQPFGANASPELKGLYVNCESQPAAWSRLPDGTFLSSALKLDPKALIALIEKSLPAEAQKEKDKALEGFGKQFLGGKDPMKDFVAHLGDEVGFGLQTQPRLVPEGAKPEAAGNVVAVPSGVLVIELQDAVAFEAAWKELTASLLKQMNSARSRGGDAMVRGNLMTINTAQALFREGDKDEDGNFDYGTLQELAAQYLVDPELAGGEKGGWVFEVRPSQTTPEFLWMATARRKGAGPKDVTYVTNHTGVIVEIDGPVALTDECEFPKGAVPMGSRPPKPVAVDPNDPNVAAFVQKKLGDKDASVLRLPAAERDQMAAVVGDGVSPCWAISAGWLYIASSEKALERALAATEGSGSLASSSEMKKIAGNQPREVAAFTHMSWSGLADQIGANAELLALNLAPPPAELAAPKPPEFPSDLPEDADAQQKAFEKYQAESDAWQKAMEGHPQKLAAWRKEHAAENAKALAPMIGSLKVLGTAVGWSRVDGEGMESFQELRLDPTAATE